MGIDDRPMQYSNLERQSHLEQHIVRWEVRFDVHIDLWWPEQGKNTTPERNSPDQRAAGKPSMDPRAVS